MDSLYPCCFSYRVADESTATDQWYQSDEQFLKDMQPMIEATPAAPRVGEVEDIAPLVAFLCTDDARWTTGSVLCANGGLYN
jgi:NAD(P)-dependent dehydrogenase (short-subunit alcohol dehydrogenase family)